jgi:transcriptional regulator GlxA family with amidase domain
MASVADTGGMTRKVLVVGFPGVQALDLVGPFEVFTSASLLLDAQGRAGYRPVVASLDGRPVDTETGLTFGAVELPDPSRPMEAIDTLVLPGGRGARNGRRDPRLIDWIVAAAPQARRVVTVCTGTFLAAEAGLLDGCRATTHWAHAAELAREFPAIEVDPDPIFVRSSPTVWTAAGVCAGIDLALALVEEDHGTELAQTVARHLVMHLRRPGGQTQFAAPVWVARAKREPIRAVQDAVESEPGGVHGINDLARIAAMSPRHFTRVFTDEVGEAPGAYVERVRTEAARRQLEQTDDTVVAIATRCGFGTAETMRRNFIRRIGISPDQYRKTFA